MGIVHRLTLTALSAVLVLSLSSGAAFAICGDNVLEPTELCDDGNLTDGDGCDSNCTPTGCGNTIVTAGETCDDGNLTDGDGCDSNCTTTACGNAIVTSGENCDDGNLTSGDGCDANCTPTGCGNTIVTAGEACDAGPSGSAACDTDCTLPSCGDNTVNPFTGETCDDGNLVSGDGCDANCTLTTCGNGVVTAPELCDDGNLVSGDGCDANCRPTGCGNGVVTSGEACDDGNLASGDGCDSNCTATGCGNGVLTAGEACDDGNLTSGDGCDSNCTATACGNSIVTAPEQCDDGNLINNDGCDANCTAPACGNGVINPPEQCDDSNVVSGDGCDANCRVTGCGNGIVTAGETCDDGNATSGDGCDANCTPTGCGNAIMAGAETCDDGNVAPGDGCRGNCTVEVCGDGIPDPQEQCDDGNLINGDGCDTNCGTTGCGNGIVTGGEQCDDSNVIDGDGCSSTCQRELLNPVPAAGDRFGHSVANAGANVIIGVPLHDQVGAINSGLAYLYSAATFQPIRIFQNPTPSAGDEFGFTVAGVGQNVAIAAPYDNTAGTHAGAVYVFDAVTGNLVRTFINPSGGGNKLFGWSLAALDANTLLIGAPEDDLGTSGGGVVYAYNVGTGSLVQVYLNPSPVANDDFGSAIAIVDGDVVVGEPGFDIPGGGFTPGTVDAGAVHVFNAVSGALITSIANPAPTAGDRFGTAITALGTHVIASAPFSHAGAVFRIDPSTGSTIDTYRPVVAVGDDEFGTSLAVVGGNKVAIGAIRGDSPSLANTGTVEVFDADTETLLQTITKATPALGDEFGRAIATSGAFIVVGAPGDDTVELDSGAVYFFPDNSCGNTVVDPLEECDDGNLVSGDGCDSNCALTACGNGVVTAPEQCDDGNNTAGDGCSPICGTEGACGDGVVSPFEQCDDHNLVSGDGCDANCKFTGCGNGIAAGAEQCDNGAANGTNLCCSATCQRIDADGDGVCDRDDVCPNTPDPSQANTDGDVFGNACDICPSDVNNDSDNDRFCTGPTFNSPALGGSDPCSRTGNVGSWTRPKALFSHLGVPPGDDRMRIKGRFRVGGLLPTIAPHVNGVHIRVTDADGGIVFDETIPGGPLWKVSGGAHNQWTYKDRSKPPGHNGIAQIVIRNLLFLDPVLFSVSIRGDFGTYPLQPGKEPVRITVELNTDALPPGGTPGRDQCGEVQFLELGRPTCTFNKFKLNCK